MNSTQLTNSNQSEIQREIQIKLLTIDPEFPLQAYSTNSKMNYLRYSGSFFLKVNLTWKCAMDLREMHELDTLELRKWKMSPRNMK